MKICIIVFGQKIKKCHTYFKKLDWFFFKGAKVNRMALGRLWSWSNTCFKMTAFFQLKIKVPTNVHSCVA